MSHSGVGESPEIISRGIKVAPRFFETRPYNANFICVVRAGFCFGTTKNRRPSRKLFLFFEKGNNVMSRERKTIGWGSKADAISHDVGWGYPCPPSESPSDDVAGRNKKLDDQNRQDLKRATLQISTIMGRICPHTPNLRIEEARVLWTLFNTLEKYRCHVDTLIQTYDPDPRDYPGRW